MKRLADDLRKARAETDWKAIEAVMRRLDAAWRRNQELAQRLVGQRQ